MVSSKSPSTTATCFCCLMKYLEALPPTIVVFKNINKAQKMTTKVIHMLLSIIATKEKRIANPALKAVGKACEMNCLIVSISFVYTDIIAP